MRQFEAFVNTLRRDLRRRSANVTIDVRALGDEPADKISLVIATLDASAHGAVFNSASLAAAALRSPLSPS